MHGECFDELFEMEIVHKMGTSGMRLVGRDFSIDFLMVSSPNLVLKPSQNASKRHARLAVSFSKIFVWGA